MTADGPLARSYEELAAARLLAANGYERQAVSRSYYAAFYAAEAALLSMGETRSKHSAVIAAFVQLAVRQHGADEMAGRLLRSLFERRGEADYGLGEQARVDPSGAVDDAEAVVTAIARWLDSREGSG